MLPVESRPGLSYLERRGWAWRISWSCTAPQNATEWALRKVAVACASLLLSGEKARLSTRGWTEGARVSKTAPVLLSSIFVPRPYSATPINLPSGEKAIAVMVLRLVRTCQDTF